MTESVDCVVIGAGVVGLAVARACARAGWETLVIEAGHAIGTGISSRNSEVMHAGIYYPPGSLKARLCVQGRHALYAYCDARGIAYQRCGKFIVATQKRQIEALRRLAATAAANGVDDLRWLERADARAKEPALECVAALESPSTGIIDSHGLMLSLQADLESAGGMVVFRSCVAGGRILAGADRGILLQIDSGQPVELLARRVVNSAGLHAQAVAAGIDGIPPGSIPVVRYAKGNYYSLSGAAPFSRLVYPIPEPGGLGVHLTLDLSHQARFGPDVEWVSAINYAVDPCRAERFHAAIRRYWPGLPNDALQPDYAGIRPKLAASGDQDADFVIQAVEQHAAAGLVNLYGIESPGLTACLAIAQEVVDRLQAEGR